MPHVPLEQAGTLLLSVGGAIVAGGLRIALIVVAVLVATRGLRAAIARLERVLIRAGEATESVPGAARKRVSTLIGLVHTLAVGAIWALGAVISLDQIGLNVTPILAGAGIAGLAVGFGAQYLVRDMISGFFLVLENQVRVGDVAVVNGTGGLVETITFRTIVLRDLAGTVHVFPHGAVTTLANMTKGWSAYVVDVGIAYREDTDRVVAVMRRVADELRRDAPYDPMILEPIEIFGVDRFGESEVVIKARLKTLPLHQWTVGREYRRRLKKAFDAEGIQIPFPQRSLHIDQVSQPVPVVLREAPGAGEPR
jgi:small conductance mechanosensitive channel